MAGPRTLLPAVVSEGMQAPERNHKDLGQHRDLESPGTVKKQMTTQMSFATRAQGPLQEVTERRPGLAIDAYPLGRLLLLRCFGDVDGIDAASEINGSGGKVLHMTRTGDEVTLLLDGSGREEEIIAALADQSAHLIPPIRWQREIGRASLVLEDRADPDALLEQFPGARLVSKRRPSPTRGTVGSYSSPLALPKLTEKQALALLAAYEAGYYEFPRKATTEQVSVSVGIARSTFEQHLNRAEHHVVRAMLLI